MKHISIQLENCGMQAYIPDIAVPMESRRSVVICPGGGYHFRSEREAEPIALVFASMGFNAYVVEYRVAPAVHPAPVLDVASAVAWVRAHASELQANPDGIAVMGFSAGGHAAGSLGVYWHDSELMAQGGFKPEDVKPNAMVLCYPVITGGEHAHRGSFKNLTGCDDLEVHAEYSLETKVTAQTPPTFIWHTFEDGAVPVENALLMASALRKNGVATELHVFLKGGHGLALCKPLTSTSPDQNIDDCAKWPEMAARFLERVL